MNMSDVARRPSASQLHLPSISGQEPSTGTRGMLCSSDVLPSIAVRSVASATSASSVAVASALTSRAVPIDPNAKKVPVLRLSTTSASASPTASQWRGSMNNAAQSPTLPSGVSAAAPLAPPAMLALERISNTARASYLPIIHNKIAECTGRLSPSLLNPVPLSPRTAGSPTVSVLPQGNVPKPMVLQPPMTFIISGSQPAPPHTFPQNNRSTGTYSSSQFGSAPMPPPPTVMDGTLPATNLSSANHSLSAPQRMSQLVARGRGVRADTVIMVNPTPQMYQPSPRAPQQKSSMIASECAKTDDFADLISGRALGSLPMPPHPIASRLSDNYPGVSFGSDSSGSSVEDFRSQVCSSQRQASTILGHRSTSSAGSYLAATGEMFKSYSDDDFEADSLSVVHTAVNLNPHSASTAVSPRRGLKQSESESGRSRSISRPRATQEASPSLKSTPPGPTAQPAPQPRLSQTTTNVPASVAPVSSPAPSARLATHQSPTIARPRTERQTTRAAPQVVHAAERESSAESHVAGPQDPPSLDVELRRLQIYLYNMAHKSYLESLQQSKPLDAIAVNIT